MSDKAEVTRAGAVKLARSLCGSDVGESSWRVQAIGEAIADAEARGRASAAAEVTRLQAALERREQDQRRLDPFNADGTDDPLPAPTEQPAIFISGIRYYAGMLDDDDNWSHSLGHIESLCKDFQAAIDIRAGKAPTATTDADLREALAYLWTFVEQANGTRFEAANAHNAIAAALFARRGEVERLQAELSELRSQANEYGPGPVSPVVGRGELEALMVEAREKLKELKCMCKESDERDCPYTIVRAALEAALGLVSK